MPDDRDPPSHPDPEHALDPRAHHAGERGRLSHRARIALIVVPIVTLVIASNVGDALSPTLQHSHPLLLIALNARNRLLVLVSNDLSAWSYYAVATLRLLVADPPFYFLGYFYGDAAVLWMEQKAPTLGRSARQFEGIFSKAAYPLVFIMPNNFICLFAGSAGMRPLWFITLNATGTVARLYVLRIVGDVFANPIDGIQRFITDYRWPLTAVTVALVVYTFWGERRQGQGEIAGLEELVEEGNGAGGPEAGASD